MKNFKDPIIKQAFINGGFRERFAIDKGNKAERVESGRVLWRFTYSAKIEYQDANGATYDVTNKRWIN